MLPKPTNIQNVQNIEFPELTQLQKRGDPTANDIKSYYEEYGRKIYLFLMTLCREPDTAEEITQETFYQATQGETRLQTRTPD